MEEREFKISEMIDKYMHKKGYTMKELGEMVGKSEATVSYWISGRNNPRIGEIQKLADIFGLTTEQMLYGDDYSTLVTEEAIMLDRVFRNMSPDKRKTIIKGLEVFYKDDFK